MHAPLATSCCTLPACSGFHRIIRHVHCALYREPPTPQQGTWKPIQLGCRGRRGGRGVPSAITRWPGATEWPLRDTWQVPERGLDKPLRQTVYELHSEIVSTQKDTLSAKNACEFVRSKWFSCPPKKSKYTPKKSGWCTFPLDNERLVYYHRQKKRPTPATTWTSMRCGCLP